MADAFRTQTADGRMNDLPFEDRFGMLVDVEYSSRKHNKVKRLCSNAELDQNNAEIRDINYTSGRKLNRELIERLSACEYITEYRNIFITGATGCGKTYMACAFGIEACRHYYTCRYVRLPDMLLDLAAAKDSGSYKKIMDRYAKPVLLIIDEWLLVKPSPSECRDIFELLHRRRHHSSTIFCSQYRPEGWYEQLGGSESPLADAILDRIVHDAYKINIESLDPSKDISMRELYGLDKSLSE
jgi:DNA replication protein DnaC